MANTTILMKGPWDVGTIPTVSLAIPNRNFTQAGQTFDLTSYITDPLDIVYTSQIVGLDTDVASYNHATKRITAVASGTLSDLRLEITWQQ